MGPYGPSVEERNRFHLRRLKEKYGAYPEEILLQKAEEAMEKAIEEYSAQTQKTSEGEH
ncbi:MAG: hypothetical protein AB2L14_29750 [Candidatus Xenobiia bacterium LiM19]